MKYVSLHSVKSFSTFILIYVQTVQNSFIININLYSILGGLSFELILFNIRSTYIQYTSRKVQYFNIFLNLLSSVLYFARTEIVDNWIWDLPWRIIKDRKEENDRENLFFKDAGENVMMRMAPSKKYRLPYYTVSHLLLFSPFSCQITSR